MEILFLRDDDIPQYVEQGVADIGILGENEVWEKDKEVDMIEKLGFGNCRLSLAIPKDEEYTGLDYFNGKRIATSYPKILHKYFQVKGIEVRSKSWAAAWRSPPASDWPTPSSIS